MFLALSPCRFAAIVRVVVFAARVAEAAAADRAGRRQPPTGRRPRELAAAPILLRRLPAPACKRSTTRRRSPSDDAAMLTAPRRQLPAVPQLPSVRRHLHGRPVSRSCNCSRRSRTRVPRPTQGRPLARAASDRRGATHPIAAAAIGQEARPPSVAAQAQMLNRIGGVTPSPPRSDRRGDHWRADLACHLQATIL